MDSTVITINHLVDPSKKDVVDDVDHKSSTSPIKEEKRATKLSILAYLKEMTSKQDVRKLIHSIKVGIALVLVSLLYLLDPLFEEVGENAMWAIMTVVVVFEFYAGATLGKGLNRGIGTILGGGLGCLAAAFAQKVGGVGNSVIVATSVFFFGALATYTRLVPSIKKRYDYGVLIFILTFNLVVVSGIRAEKVLELARERLSTIGMGFAICITISLLVFPSWASNEFHQCIASKFEVLAQSIEGCMEEYFRVADEKENQKSNSTTSSKCKSVLNSKAKDEQLANFAKWEPWHGKFGLYYPWGKYLQIGEHLRDLASSVLSLENCLQSPRQPSSTMRQSIKEPCEEVGLSLGWTLRELGESIKKMRKCHQANRILPKLKAIRQELSLVVSLSKIAQMENNVDAFAIASFVFLLMEMVEKVEDLAKEVEELGENAAFRA